MTQLLETVGRIAVSWNEAEHVLNRLLWLYLDTDNLTASILTKPLRASDREKLLRDLINAKEIDVGMAEEIREAIKLCAACRENRNTILHNAGGNDGAFSEGANAIVTQAYHDMVATTGYLRTLQIAVTKVIYSRAGRETPIDDESFDDELLPLQQFEKPDRPEKPKLVARGDILPEGFDG